MVIINNMHHFSTILAGLRAAVAARASRTRALEALLVVVWQRLAGMAQQFERLVVLWRAGRLPQPRAASESRQGAADRAPVAARVRVPTGQGWLLAHMQEAAQFGAQMQHFLSDAEMLAFLAEVPQAGRIVRPLCRMLGLPVPLVVARMPVKRMVAKRVPAVASVEPPLVSVRRQRALKRVRAFSSAW